VTEAARRVVLGIGNADRGDDAVGCLVVRRLRGLAPAGVCIEEHDGEATLLLARFEQADAVWLIDAACSGSAPGTVRRLDCATDKLPASAGSSHGLGPAEAIALARALGCLPRSCIVYAIEGEAFGVGAPVSPQVEAAVEKVARAVLGEITAPA
jgi:hydrogenase maturation protease